MAFSLDRVGKQATSSPLETTLQGIAAGEPIDVEISNTVNVAFASRRPALTLAAESSDVIEISVQLKDGSDTNVAIATNIIVHLVDANGIDSLAAAFTLGDSGAGSVVSTTANARLIYLTDATGLAEIDITDVVGASGSTVYALVQVISGTTWTGGFDFIAVVFD